MIGFVKGFNFIVKSAVLFKLQIKLGASGNSFFRIIICNINRLLQFFDREIEVFLLVN